MLYKNSKLGSWLAANHPEAKSFHRGLEQILTGHEQILDHYEQKIVGHQAIPTGENDEEGNPLFTQGDPIYGDDHERPVYRDGEPIYEYGAEQFELVGWQDEWGTPPTEEELEAFVPPPPEENPVTDVYSQTVQTLSEREVEANQRITDLKASTLLHLVAVGSLMADGTQITSQNVNDEGTRFIFYHAAVISAFKLAGGSNVAGQGLYKAFTGKGSKSLFPWVDDQVEAIFQGYLTP